MKVLAISDLHLERRTLGDVPPLNESFDVLVCAGDIWEGQPENAIQSVVELARGKPAIVVPGNHDLYAGIAGQRTIAEHITLMRDEAERQNARAGGEIVTVLSADNPVCEIDQTRFVGLTLWSDWSLAGHWIETKDDFGWAARARGVATSIRTAPREYGAIRTERGGWTPYDAVAEHAREKAILLDELVYTHGGPTVVVTHHPPLVECVDAYRRFAHWWTPAFYVSDILKSLPEHMQPDVWVCGHVHAPYDAISGRTRVVCNPVEGGKFKPDLIIDLNMAHEDGCYLPTEDREADEPEGMQSCPAPEDWRAELVWAYHRIFQPPEAHPELAEGLPDCGEGWLHILDSACFKIQHALDERDAIRVTQIKEKYGTLRISWEGTLSSRAKAEVEEAIELACARSVCTCEICGDEGRLYRRGDWLATACSDHAKGAPVPVKPGLENIHIVRGTIDGEVRILSCRRYNRDSDSFVEIDPDSLEIGELDG